ncbi:lysophospholipid acyltransferase, partial [Rhizoclosmatium hyalinum]
HLKSQFFSDVDAPRFDQTIPMMVAVQKMATFAWSVHDGTRPNRELSKTQQSLKLAHIPSLLDYLGFIFFYPAFILGPSFHYKTYSDFISGTGAFTLQPTQKLLPGRWKYLAETIITGAVCSLLNIIFAPRVPYEFGLTDAFLEYTWFQRASYFFVAALVQQMQFFGAWKLAEGACVLCGFGYVGPVEGKVGVYKWNRCENVRIWELEFPENPRMFM